MTQEPHYTIKIANNREPEYVACIRAVSPRLHVVYTPKLRA